MDYKSYLLDFKSSEEVESNVNNTLLGSVPTPVQSVSESDDTITKNNGHHTMEFFEMCAALIIQLAR